MVCYIYIAVTIACAIKSVHTKEEMKNYSAHEANLQLTQYLYICSMQNHVYSSILQYCLLWCHICYM